MALFEAYIDESGTDRRADTLAVAAYVADVDSWQIFEGAWRDRLARSNVDVFHASNPGCDFLRPHLRKAISDYAAFGVVASVTKAEYEAEAGPRIKAGFAGAYGLCALTAAFNIFHWIVTGGGDRRIGFVFESGQPGLDYTKTILRKFLVPGAPLVSIAEATKAECVQLQTADFLSHVRSTNDTVWLNRLRQASMLYEDHIVGRRLQLLTKDINKIQNAKKLRKWRLRKGLEGGKERGGS